MNLNDSFLATLTRAFQTYLQTSARSNEKLKFLHAKIATDLADKLGENFSVCGLGVGMARKKKYLVDIIQKKVDIVICKDGTERAGVAVKFVMSNYSQNANNYFEGMLGETANLRSNRLPYFQILVVPECMPYFEKDGSIGKIEELKTHHLHKYLALSNDNPETFFHTPNKTLLVVIKLPNFSTAHNNAEYKALCANKNLQYSQKFSADNDINSVNFQESVIFNDYELFLDKVYHSILAI